MKIKKEKKNSNNFDKICLQKALRKTLFPSYLNNRWD